MRCTQLLTGLCHGRGRLTFSMATVYSHSLCFRAILIVNFGKGKFCQTLRPGYLSGGSGWRGGDSRGGEDARGEVLAVGGGDGGRVFKIDVEVNDLPVEYGRVNCIQI